MVSWTAGRTSALTTIVTAIARRKSPRMRTKK
jgi:hypothetical protein